MPRQNTRVVQCQTLLHFRTQAWDGRFESVDFGDKDDETVPFNFPALEMVVKVRLTCL